MILVFDIETDGLLPSLTKIHCISLKRLGIDDDPLLFVGDKVSEGLDHLSQSDCIIGHNIQAFDIPAIKKIFPSFTHNKIRDTLIISRLQHPHDMMRHSLEAWGDKLKIPKGDFGKQTDWSTYTDEMGKYCQQDVRVNVRIWDYLKSENFSAASWELEHEFARHLDKMMSNGVKIDVAKLKLLGDDLVATEATMRRDLTAGIPPFVDKTMFVPKRNNATTGYVKGVPFTKVKETPFNPGSRLQCVRLLKEKYGWKPSVLTKKGRPEISGEVLRGLDYPEAQKLADFYDVRKLLGMAVTGKEAWINHVKNGRIYGRINHNGAVTGRCTHSSPNLAQVPSPSGYRGEECRKLFIAPRGRKIVGCDAKGLELRNLAHYMAAYDGGKYAKVILDGDVHTTNQEAAGIDTRDNAKVFIYAHNYGAGDTKLGNIIVPKATENMQKLVGRKIRAKFMATLPALNILIKQVKLKAKRTGYLVGLDGRKLYVHSDHVALNVLLQGAGAVFMKKVTCLALDAIDKENLDAMLILHVHDEFQFDVIDKDVDRVKEILEESMTLAGEHFNYKILMEGESKSGETWYDTH